MLSQYRAAIRVDRPIRDLGAAAGQAGRSHAALARSMHQISTYLQCLFVARVLVAITKYGQRGIVHRDVPIEAEDELIEVVLEVGFAQSMVDTQTPPLEV